MSSRPSCRKRRTREQGCERAFRRRAVQLRVAADGLTPAALHVIVVGQTEMRCVVLVMLAALGCATGHGGQVHPRSAASRPAPPESPPPQSDGLDEDFQGPKPLSPLSRRKISRTCLASDFERRSVEAAQPAVASAERHSWLPLAGILNPTVSGADRRAAEVAPACSP